MPNIAFELLSEAIFHLSRLDGEQMDNKYGRAIREIRLKNGDTIETLATKLHLSWSSLGKYERGERKVVPELLENIANLYGVPLSYFYGTDANTNQEHKEIALEWIEFVKEMDARNITPDMLTGTLSLLEKLWGKPTV